MSTAIDTACTFQIKSTPELKFSGYQFDIRDSSGQLLMISSNVKIIIRFTPQISTVSIVKALAELFRLYKLQVIFK